MAVLDNIGRRFLINRSSGCVLFFRKDERSRSKIRTVPRVRVMKCFLTIERFEYVSFVLEVFCNDDLDYN